MDSGLTPSKAPARAWFCWQLVAVTTDMAIDPARPSFGGTSCMVSFSSRGRNI